MKSALRSLPGMRNLSIARQRLSFSGSAGYWEHEYKHGGTSGPGSYGELARGKADFLNRFTRRHELNTVTEFGCGDGNQLALAEYPAYIGLDVSKSAIQLCKERFADDMTKSFFLYDGSCYINHAEVFSADLAISLDVVHHLVEDLIFERYMRHLFAAGRQYVVIYTTNEEILGTAPHVRHRHFSPWVEENCPGWRLIDHAVGQNTGRDRSDFFVYHRLTACQP